MSAQNVSIGGGGSTSDKVAINLGLKNYNFNQSIYLGSEIKKSGEIESLTFKLNTTGNLDISSFKKWSVRLKEIPKSHKKYTVSRYKVNPYKSGLTSVFDGNIQYDKATGYLKVVLRSPFKYNHSNNLIVEITEKSSGRMPYDWSKPSPKFKVFWTTYERSCYYSSYSFFTPNDLIYSIDACRQVPQVIIGFKAVVVTPPVKASELHSTLSVDKPVIGANNKEIATITVVLKDKDGKKLNKSGGKLSFSPTGVSNITDNGDGTYTAKFKTNTPNDYSFTATITSADKTKVTIKTPANIKATKVMEVTVGTGGCGQAAQSNIPAKYDNGSWNGGKKNSWSLMLYKASDLNNLAGKLTTIGFYTDCKNKTYKRAKKQRVYVKEVSENEITNNSHPDLSTFTKVFDGEYTWKSGASFDTSRNDITLTEDFVYSGTKSLVVYYENESGIEMGHSLGNISFLWDNKGENRVAYAGYKNSEKNKSKGRISKELPVTYFKFSPAPIAIQPVISMQNPAEASICENNSFTFSDISVTENPILKWTTDGTGLFEDDAKLLSKYTPSDQDATKGFVTLSLTATKGKLSDTKTFKLNIQADAKSAGTDGDLTVCKGVNPTNDDLFAALEGNPEVGGTWAENGLVYTYTQTTDLGCKENSAKVTITIQDDAKSAGADGKLTVCKGVNPTNDDLFAALEGNPEVGGTWTSKDLVHTYTQTTDLGCKENFASVTITIQDDAKSAGADGKLTVCKGVNPTNDDLFAALGGNPEAGGTWASNGLVYTYTQTTDLGCKENSASVTITIQADAKSAGADGALTVCKGVNPTNDDLFAALEGNPEAGGTWASNGLVHTYTQTTNLGCNNKSASVTITIQDDAKSAGKDGDLTVCKGTNPTNDDLFAALEGNPEAGGTWAENGLVYTYTQTTILGCNPKSANVTITIQDDAKSAGLDGTLTVCKGINPTNDELFEALKGNPELGGTWAKNGLVYTYTQTTKLKCKENSASVTITIQDDAKSAGADGKLTVCKGVNPTEKQLFESLGGNPEVGGTWTSKDLVHTYTQTTDLGCKENFAKVTITIQDDAKSAGTDGDLTVCKGTNPTNDELFAALEGNPEVGGTWTSKDLVHTYTQTTDLGCKENSAKVTITIQDDAKSAGTDGDLTVCKGVNPTNDDLFAALEGNPEAGGTWAENGLVYTYTQTTDLGCKENSANVTITIQDDAKSAGANGKLTVCKGVNPTNDDLFAALEGNPEAGGTWTKNGLVYIYKQTTDLGCKENSAKVTITIQDDAKNAGTDGKLTVCKGVNPTNDELFAALEGNPEAGGTWAENGLVYTYTQTTDLGCKENSAKVTITIQDDAKSAGTDGDLTVCKGTNPTEKQLFAALEGNPEAGGTWASNGLVYTYTQTTILGCNPKSAKVTITIQDDAKSAGTDGDLTVCKGVNPTNDELFAALEGNPEVGGTWAENGLVYTYTQTTKLKCKENSAKVTITIQDDAKSAGTDGDLTVCKGINPTEKQLFDALEGNPEAGGTWTKNGLVYTYTQTTSLKCKENSASVTITIQDDAKSAGADGKLTVCKGINPTNDELFAALEGNPEAGGTWAENGLVYTYTQTTILGCNPKSANVTVDEDTAKNAGENGMLTVCKGTVLTEKQLFDALEGSPDLGGTWASNGLVYTYTQVASLGCNPNFSRVVVMEQSEAKSAGADATLTICKGTTLTEKQLFAALKGNPETGGTWSENGLIYTYTQTTSLGCNNKSASVTVNEESEVKSAGLDGILSMLDGTEPTEDDLFAALEGFPDTDGSWVKKNSNTYIYTITSTSPCTKNKTATIRIKRNQEVANGFSPNGDGVNDTWIVLPDVANKYPKNIMRIYNRHGNLVYKALTYNNDWDGTSNGKITINKESKLPVGSYVYILELNNATKKVLKGWVYINY
ncbi:gliding motility-associated C-terminal domain-containing protein [Tenacibaculum finnmarkense]|uniref:T9SS type B sorting domain-containing protein n=1 Tax=Tenacibaculum finnmarkense TaxID=2781243 RepID=UPI001E647EB0|nr:gliding motility-associated C-terminal domain-containing protein [Tenacibaculum finnmarkense]MCD8423101.1 gliding motility-associated C-terminal domain-containing protein [Tenacibaculum finnmarkense genomovar ulcerans]MCG8239316.1 gliding motility-associated C-terminal domain-containing protein [Tenacibaculum finnmarkense genomovar ulcerans]